MEIGDRVILIGAVASSGDVVLEQKCTADGYGFTIPKRFLGKLAPNHKEILSLVKYFLPVNGVIFAKLSADNAPQKLKAEIEDAFISQLAQRLLTLSIAIQGQNPGSILGGIINSESRLEIAILLPVGTIVEELPHGFRVCWDDNPENIIELKHDEIQKIAPGLTQVFSCIQEFLEENALVIAWLHPDKETCALIQEEIENWHVSALAKDFVNFVSAVQGGPELYSYKVKVDIDGKTNSDEINFNEEDE